VSPKGSRGALLRGQCAPSPSSDSTPVPSPDPYSLTCGLRVLTVFPSPPRGENRSERGGHRGAEGGTTIARHFDWAVSWRDAARAAILWDGCLLSRLGIPSWIAGASPAGKPCLKAWSYVRVSLRSRRLLTATAASRWSPSATARAVGPRARTHRGRSGASGWPGRRRGDLGQLTRYRRSVAVRFGTSISGSPRRAVVRDARVELSREDRPGRDLWPGFRTSGLGLRDVRVLRRCPLRVRYTITGTALSF
jgi:hypothetical protein